jgi:formylglycine-generating enzyme required for sulfatase activity
VWLTWNLMPDATKYRIYRSTTSGGTFTLVDSTGIVNTFTNVLTSYNAAYYYKIEAVGLLGASAQTAEVVATQPSLIGMKGITGGTFSMGETGIATPVHSVTVANFYIDSTEVRQGDYLGLMGVNPSSFTGDLNRPIESVSWFDAVLFCNARSKLEGKDTVYTYTGVSGTPGAGCSGLTALAIDLTKNGYRLPTEAQWEYACRGGTTTTYWWGADTIGMGDRAWTFYNSSSNTHIVATKLANAYGLYDMAGNVKEWCNDWSADYTADAVTDPAGPSMGTHRVLRGGSWVSNLDNVRSADRNDDSPGSGSNDCGFRVALPW